MPRVDATRPPSDASGVNVFRVHDDPIEAARALCDAHLASQVKEAAQILSTALWLRARPSGAGVALYLLQQWGLYRPTHAEHPCCRAAAASPAFCTWTAEHARALDAERLHRRPGSRPHASLEVVERAARALGGAAPVGAVEPWPQALGEGNADLRRPGDPVAAYRAYYARCKVAAPGGWSRLAPLGRWTRREPPAWLADFGAVAVEVGPGLWEARRRAAEVRAA